MRKVLSSTISINKGSLVAGRQVLDKVFSAIVATEEAGKKGGIRCMIILLIVSFWQRCCGKMKHWL